jgi:hypothetical protein
MTTTAATGTDAVAGNADPAWGRTARGWGIFAGIAFLVATAAFLVEATGLLATAPEYVATSAGQLADEAVFHAASFAYGQRVLWDFALRDGLFFFAYLALIPLGLGLREVAGRRLVAPQLALAFLTVAAVFGCMNAFHTFVMLDYWRNSGWEQVPPAIMTAVGRDLDLMDEITRWDGIASYATLALGLYYAGRTCRGSSVMPGWLGAVAYAGVAILAALIVTNVIPDLDGASKLLSLAIGVVIGPIFTVGLGVSVARAAKPSPAAG